MSNNVAEEASAVSFESVGQFHLLDVGQGDCSIIFDKNERAAFVIDCPASGVRQAAGALKQMGAERVPGVLVTHWDLDHFGGILRLADACGAEALYYNHDTICSYPVDKTIRRAALRQLLEEPYRSMRHGHAMEGVCGSVGNVEWVLLAPSQFHVTHALVHSDRNLASIVVKASIKGRSLVIGGDADSRVWRRLIDEGADISADVLRWPHHGAAIRGSGLTDRVVLEAVRPAFVVISVGSKNRYGHPDPAAVEVISKTSLMACTQVTSRCHPAVAGRQVQCGGNLVFEVSATGRLVATSGWVTHQQIVDGWDHPICRL